MAKRYSRKTKALKKTRRSKFRKFLSGKFKSLHGGGNKEPKQIDIAAINAFIDKIKTLMKQIDTIFIDKLRAALITLSEAINPDQIKVSLFSIVQLITNSNIINNIPDNHKSYYFNDANILYILPEGAIKTHLENYLKIGAKTTLNSLTDKIKNSLNILEDNEIYTTIRNELLTDKENLVLNNNRTERCNFTAESLLYLRQYITEFISLTDDNKSLYFRNMKPDNYKYFEDKSCDMMYIQYNTPATGIIPRNGGVDYRTESY